MKTFYVLIWKLLHEILRKKGQGIKSAIMCYFWYQYMGILVCVVHKKIVERPTRRQIKNDYFGGDMNKEEG